MLLCVQVRLDSSAANDPASGIICAAGPVDSGEGVWCDPGTAKFLHGQLQLASCMHMSCEPTSKPPIPAHLQAAGELQYHGSSRGAAAVNWASGTSSGVEGLSSRVRAMRNVSAWQVQCGVSVENASVLERLPCATVTQRLQRVPCLDYCIHSDLAAGAWLAHGGGLGRAHPSGHCEAGGMQMWQLSMLCSVSRPHVAGATYSPGFASHIAQCPTGDGAPWPLVAARLGPLVPPAPRHPGPGPGLRPLRLRRHFLVSCCAMAERCLRACRCWAHSVRLQAACWERREPPQIAAAAARPL